MKQFDRFILNTNVNQLAVLMFVLGTSLIITTEFEPDYEPDLYLSQDQQLDYDEFGFAYMDEEVLQLKEQIVDIFHRDEETAADFSQWIYDASESASIEPLLLTSIIATESSFKKDALSDKGAVGPSQIMPKYWQDFCESLDFEEDPRDNIFCAAKILAKLDKDCDGEDEKCVVKSYYMGYPSFKAGKQIASATRYYQKVQNYKAQFALRD